MTANAPIPARASSAQEKSKLRTYVTKAVRWWRDRRSGSRRDEPAMALQPFSFWPGQISALSGEGGDKPSIVSGYAFHTDYVPSAGGRLTYTIRLAGLTGTRGSLILSINMLDENGESLPPKTRSIAIEKLLAADGVVEFSILGTS